MGRKRKIAHPAPTKMQAPRGTLQAPQGTLQAPQGILQAPQGTLQAPQGTLQAPTLPSNSHSHHSRPKNNIDRRLVAARITLEAVLNDSSTQDVLAPYGYSRAELLRGQALREQAQALELQLGARNAEQITARHTRNNAHMQAHTIYMRHLRITRVALRREPALAETLDLGERKRPITSWVGQARRFYSNVLADSAILEKLDARGITLTALQAAQAQVEAVEELFVEHTHCQRIARTTSSERVAALRALNAWMSEFKQIARVALADQPLTRERLGI